MAGSPCGTSPSSFTPRTSSPSSVRGHDAADHDEQRHRPVLEEDLARAQHDQRRRRRWRATAGLVSCRCLKKWPLFSQKLPCAPWKPNSLGNCVLARKSATPHLNPTITLSEMKFTIVPALDQPGDERDEGDEQRRAGGERAETGRVAAGDVAQRRADEQRDGGRDGDGGVPRAAKQPEDQPGEQAGVKPRLGRQVGQRGVAQPGRQEIGGERDAGDQVAPQPRRVIGAEPTQRGYPSGGPVQRNDIGLS